MNILVIGGLHGNEPLGIEIVRAIERDPIPNVTAIFGNPAAIKKGVRFIESDLNRVFPGNQSGMTEERRAAFLMEATKSYDVVLDFHNTHASGNDFGFVGNDTCTVLPVATFLGFSRVIIADYNCINKFVPTCLSCEVSLDSPEMSVPRWIEKIRVLAETTPLPKTLPTLYRYAFRVTRDMQNANRFTWRVMEPISPRDRDRLSLPQDTYFPIFVDDAYTPWNYAGLIIKAK
jgi:hypothetical protein